VGVKPLRTAKTRLQELSAQVNSFVELTIMKNKLLAIALTIMVVSVGWYSWWNMNRVSLDNDPVGYSVEVSTPIYAELDYIPATDMVSVSSAITNARILGPIPIDDSSDKFKLPELKNQSDKSERVYRSEITQKMIDSLLEQVSDLIYARLVNKDPQAYIAMRERWGAIPPSVQDLDRRGLGTIDNLYKYFLDRPSVESDSFLSFFSETFQIWEKSTGGLKAIPDGGDGLVSSFGLINSSYSSSTELGSSVLGTRGWFGSNSATGGVYFNPPHTVAELLKQYGTLPYAEVGIILAYKNALPQPLVFQFVWNPKLNDWQLNSALFSNRKDLVGKILPLF